MWLIVIDLRMVVIEIYSNILGINVAILRGKRSPKKYAANRFYNVSLTHLIPEVFFRETEDDQKKIY